MLRLRGRRALLRLSSRASEGRLAHRLDHARRRPSEGTGKQMQMLEGELGERLLMLG